MRTINYIATFRLQRDMLFNCDNHNYNYAFADIFFILSRVEHFAKFREMQKMILQKTFREKWLQNFAKMNSTNFTPFIAPNWTKIRPN